MSAFAGERSAMTAEIERRIAAADRADTRESAEKPIVPAGMSYARALEIAIAAREDPQWQPIDPFEDLGHPFQVHRRASRTV